MFIFEFVKYTPRKQTCRPKNEGLVQMIFLFKVDIFRFHVSFWGLFLGYGIIVESEVNPQSEDDDLMGCPRTGEA